MCCLACNPLQIALLVTYSTSNCIAGSPLREHACMSALYRSARDVAWGAPWPCVAVARVAVHHLIHTTHVCRILHVVASTPVLSHVPHITPHPAATDIRFFLD
jgi:hypothetical protein